jgi:hypothetical protein
LARAGINHRAHRAAHRCSLPANIWAIFWNRRARTYYFMAALRYRGMLADEWVPSPVRV